MKLTIAAIRSGTDPVGKLPAGSFHRWLEDSIHCLKCDATYTLIVAWDQYVDRFFEQNARNLITMLRKAVQLGHGTNHHVTHFETAGVVVRSFANPNRRHS